MRSRHLAGLAVAGTALVLFTACAWGAPESTVVPITTAFSGTVGGGAATAEPSEDATSTAGASLLHGSGTADYTFGDIAGSLPITCRSSDDASGAGTIAGAGDFRIVGNCD